MSVAHHRTNSATHQRDSMNRIPLEHAGTVNSMDVLFVECFQEGHVCCGENPPTLALPPHIAGALYRIEVDCNVPCRRSNAKLVSDTQHQQKASH